MKFYRMVIFLISDSICISLAISLAIWLRFEVFDPEHLQSIYLFVPIVVPISILIFWLFGLYNRSLRYTSISDLMAIFCAVTLCSMGKINIVYFYEQINFSRAIMVLDWVLSFFLIASSRIAPRILLSFSNLEPFRTWVYGELKFRGKRALIYGAGQAGESVLREIKRNQNLSYAIIGFIDDEPKKTATIIHGVKVLGTRNELNEIVEKNYIEEIIIAIPSASGEIFREIIKLCDNKKIRFKTILGLQDLMNGKFVNLQMQDISIEDLLRRLPSQINLAEIAAFVTSKVVLVTGAGGSIGSEICRQIIPFKPGKLILLGRGENSIDFVHQELLKNEDLGKCRLVPIIANIQDLEKLKQIFSEFRPQIIFHAAAHKHVPMMEMNPEEAVKNNILGTRNLVKVSLESGVERFVMISTDKAVNPTSVMGATKRVAEMVLKVFARESPIHFVAVRFGNVLGSRGSVIPLFKKQIERGGPITITHPQMVRYFMTIPEASKLVIQAGAFGKGGEVFILDMGEPVKILDLANDLIRLAGLEAGNDIEINFTGIRPGEKLYEEILTAEEGVTATRNSKIYIAKPEEVNEKTLMERIELLSQAAESADSKKIIDILKLIVPSFTPDRDKVFNQPNFKSGKRLENVGALQMKNL